MSAWKRMMLALGLVDEYEQEEDGARRAPGEGPPPGGQARPLQRPPPRVPVQSQPGPVRRTPTGPSGVRSVGGGSPPGSVPRPGSRPGGVVVRPPGIMDDTAARAEVVEPLEINDAKKIADLIRRRIPVLMNVRTADPDMARRVVDFASGLTYALDGSLKRVAQGAILVSPPRVELSSREVRRLSAMGLYDADD